VEPILVLSTLNCNGLFNKIDRITEIINKNNIRWLFATETWWDTSRRLRFPIVASAARERIDGQTGHCPYGCALLMNSSLQDSWSNDIVVVATDPGGQFIVFNDGDVQIIGLYLSPVSGVDDEAMENSINTIDRAMTAAEKKPKAMRLICGDLNIRLSDITGDREYTALAHREILAKLMGYGYNIVAQDRWRPTFKRGNGQSTVDYWMANVAAMQFLRPTCVSQTEPDWYCQSDHFVLTMHVESLRLDPTEAPPPIEYKRWRIGKLETPRIRRAYDEAFQPVSIEALLSLELVNPQVYIDEMYDLVMAPIIRNAETIIGWDHRRKGVIQRISLGQRARRLLSEQRSLLARRELEGENDMTDEELWEIQERLDDISSIIDEEIAKKRKKRYREFSGRVDQLPARELSKILCSLKASRSSNRNSLASEPADMEGYAEHFYDQYNAFGEEIEVPYAIGRDEEWGRIEPYEVRKAIAWMPNGKAPGRSKFVAELLKPIAWKVAPSLAHLFSECCRLGTIPREWGKALLVPIPKVQNPTGIKEHRPISLLEHMRKLFELCINKAIYERVDRDMNMSQGGFREKRGTLDQVCALHEMIIQHKRRTKRLPIVAFLDIKAAYDSVDRRFLYQALERMGLPSSMIQVIRALSEGNHSRVVVNGRESREFSHRAGVMQGSVLSPTLYSAFLNGLAEELGAAGELSLGNTRLSTFLYADDMAIVADNQEKMQRLLDICERYSMAHRFRFNPRKCEVFGCDRLRLYGELLPTAEIFKYLGVWFKPTGIDWKMHVTRMIDKASKTAQFYGHLGYNGTGFQERTKLTIYKTFLRTVMEYAMAIMPVQGNKGLIEKLDKAQHRILCRMFGVHWTTNKSNVRALSGILPYSKRHEELRAKWGAIMLDKGARFTVHHAREAYQQRPLAKSCFRGLADNALFQTLAPLREYSRRQHYEEPRNPFWQARLDYRVEQAKQQAVESSRPGAFTVDWKNNRPRQLYSLSRQPDPVRRLCSLWMLGRLMGKPPRCYQCGEWATMDHMERSCLGYTGIDRQIRRRDFYGAALKIQKTLKDLVIDDRFLHWMVIRIGVT
jgi:Reverse transcriptase (RNA-dependent DNA polymerase)